ncbi:hypothetical protein MLD38_033237 [Melastoma candidum]|uniref:Uncharacterized protein n=1 Tax=Melastoma candidum TaxID=119954 RepID=A0ACB9M683_9MYRT|nr:hypothetical protein MLD38_033237 [Melastoma candidum]
MESSILSIIGTELIGVMSPVSICMFLVVLLVYSLSASTPFSAPPLRTAATLVYLENPADTVSQKLEGALLNALVFVVLIAAVTFLLVLLYYYNFTSFLKYYMNFSTFVVLATMGGSILLSVIQRFSVPVDAITSGIFLYNFTIVGVLSVFSKGVPILFRQGYMVCLGIIVAAWFTKLPEWTTWVLLVALAVYDLVAVLAPGGPLKILVELASRRDEELPALVYEARPVSVPNRGRARTTLGMLVGGVSDDRSVELQSVSRENVVSRDRDMIDPAETSPLVNDPRDNHRETSSSEGGSSSAANFGSDRVRDVEIQEMSPLVEMLGGDRDSEDSGRGIRLGLGDFIFYSVLVGRAAMYDLMTVYACYLAILSGLACTLLLLSVCRRALPALPISIALGVMFYFLTRLLMEPFIVGAATNLVMF